MLTSLFKLPRTPPSGGVLAGLLLGILLVYQLLAEPALAQAPNGAQFEARLVVTQHSDGPREVQDVTGRVIARDGRGIDGVTVRVAWDGGQFVTQTSGGGFYKFTLTRGKFRLDLADRPSSVAQFEIDGRSDITVDFVESSSAAPAPAAPGQPTAPATVSASPSPTPTPTSTPTATPTITPTPTPAGSPLPSVGTPIALLTATAVELPTPALEPPETAQTTGIASRLGFGLEIDSRTFLLPFLVGVLAAAALTAISLVVVALRR